MKFFFTMNMQSRSGNPTHQVIGTVRGANTLQDILRLVEGNEFLIVEEYYKNSNDGYYSRGETILNTMHIGKVKTEG